MFPLTGKASDLKTLFLIFLSLKKQTPQLYSGLGCKMKVLKVPANVLL